MFMSVYTVCQEAPLVRAAELHEYDDLIWALVALVIDKRALTKHGTKFQVRTVHKNKL